MWKKISIWLAFLPGLMSLFDPGGVAVEAIYINGRYLADGAFSGRLSAVYKGNTVSTEIYFSGILYDLSGPVGELR